MSQPSRLSPLSRRSFMSGSAAVAGMAIIGRHAAAQTPQASPVSGDIAPFQERLGELLAMVPPLPEGASEEQAFAFAFSDIDRQLTSLGLQHPVGDDVPEGFLFAIEALPLISPAFQAALLPEWWETFGFEPFSVGRALEVGASPDAVTVYAGGIDTARVRDALLAAGYTEVDQETGGSYLSFGEEVDFDSPVGQLGMGAMNQAVIGDGAVVFAQSEATIQRVTQVMSGNAPSLLDETDWGDLMATFADDIVGVIALHPVALSELGDVTAMEQVALGVREGADNSDLQDTMGTGVGELGLTSIEDFPPTRARVQVRIRYTDEATAASEVEAIPQRWQRMRSPLTQEPMINLMLVESAGVAESDPTVAAVDLRVKGSSGWWYQMVFQNDLAPFVPSAE